MPTTSRNPIFDGIYKGMHLTVGNVLRTLIHSEPPRGLADAEMIIDSALATVSHVIRTNVSQVTGHSPGALAFHRDMMLDVPLGNLRRINVKGSSYAYQPGVNIKKKHEYTKLGRRWDGLVEINITHANGNATVNLRESVIERLNIT